MKDKTVINEDVALNDLELFVNRFVKKPVPREELKDTYPDVLDAIMDGYLSFKEDGSPLLSLKNPIKNVKGEISISEINFRTRIKPTTLADLAKGLNAQKEIFTLQLRMVAYIIDQPVQMLDNFDRYDYDVLSQVATVFT